MKHESVLFSENITAVVPCSHALPSICAGPNLIPAMVAPYTAPRPLPHKDNFFSKDSAFCHCLLRPWKQPFDYMQAWATDSPRPLHALS